MASAEHRQIGWHAPAPYFGSSDVDRIISQGGFRLWRSSRVWEAAMRRQSGCLLMPSPKEVGSASRDSIVSRTSKEFPMRAFGYGTLHGASPKPDNKV